MYSSIISVLTERVEITRCFIDNNFTGFEREKKNVVFLGLTQYDETFTGIITGYTQEEPPSPLRIIWANMYRKWAKRRFVLRKRKSTLM